MPMAEVDSAAGSYVATVLRMKYTVCHNIYLAVITHVFLYIQPQTALEMFVADG